MRGRTLWFESTKQFCHIFLCPLSSLPQPQLLWWGVGSGKKVQEEERGGGAGRCQFSDVFQLMLTTYLYAAYSTKLSEPLRNNLFSLSEQFQKENKNKKPQIFSFWGLTNQQALSGLGQRMQWSLPPLNALRTSTIDSIRHCVTLDTEEVSEAAPSPWPAGANTRAENPSQSCYRKS